MFPTMINVAAEGCTQCSRKTEGEDKIGKYSHSTLFVSISKGTKQTELTIHTQKYDREVFSFWLIY